MDPEATLPDPTKYRPLVPLGANREEILEGVVNDWCTPIRPDQNDRHLVQTKGTLVRVRFYDENRDEPIDLGEVIRRMEERLGHSDTDSSDWRPELAIRLSGCLIDRCECKGLRIRARFVAHNSVFRGGANFVEARFGDKTRFDGTRFEKGGHFSQARLGNDARFDSTQFKDGALFIHTRFGDDAFFHHAALARLVRFLGTASTVT